MSAKMKGIYKSFKYITQIFVVKEREMEIGYPTDVKHVAHIGLDDPSGSGSAPDWMSEFKTAASFGEISERRDSNATAVTALTHWSSHSQDLDLSIGYQSASDMSRELQQIQPTNVPKKSKRKKSTKSNSSPKSSSSSSRAAKSKAICKTIEPTPSYQL